MVRLNERCSERVMLKHFKRLLIISTVACCSLAALINVSPSHAQGKFYSTPTRGGAEGAKESAQIQALTQENVSREAETAANAVSITANTTDIASNATDIGTIGTRIEGVPTCGNSGMLAGPTHAQADGSGCVPSLQVQADGNVVLQSGITLGTLSTCDSTVAGSMRYNATTKKIEYCNGTVWGGLGGGSGCDFNFPAVTNATPDTFYTSSDAVYSSTTATAQITADTAATIRKNAVDTGLSSGVTINQSNSVGIRGKSAAIYNQITGFTMDIGDYTACWQITTKEQDATPDAFTFTALTGQARSTLVTSNSVTVANFDGPIAVSVSGDGGVQLQVNSGTWGTSDTISAGDTLKLRMTTDAGYEVAYTATVAIGSSSVGWSVTTEGNCTPGSTTYSSVGSYNFTMPASGCTVVAKLWGAGGGAGGRQSQTNSGGGGAFAQKTISLPQGTVVEVRVGGGGAYGEQTSYFNGGGGGGASSIHYSGSVLAAAGGGGGGGGMDGAGGKGGGGGQAGASTTSGCGGTGGQPGTSGGVGANGASQSGAYMGYNSGSGSQAASGGPNCPGQMAAGGYNGGGAGGNGALGDVTSTSCGNNNVAGGGGGGGGYPYGGGGGGYCSYSLGAGGGGGGASIGDTVVAGNYRTPGNTGDSAYAGNAGLGGLGASSSGNPGRVVISWQ